MRELKFRVWDKKQKKMLVAQSINRAGCATILLKNQDIVILPQKQIKIMQYTGLNDKNGKEIYEGDIVGFKWTKRLYVVTYRIYDASFILENDEWEEAIHLSLDKDDFEVFGNIHENPELLEKEK